MTSEVALSGTDAALGRFAPTVRAVRKDSTFQQTTGATYEAKFERNQVYVAAVGANWPIERQRAT